MAGGQPQHQHLSREQTTMAVVFSDIVGSTALRTRMGEVDFTALREAHDALAADLVEACGGQVVRWQGDGLVVAFSSAGRALEYASMLQPSVDRLGDSDAHFDLRVGIGLGDVLNETTGDYDGPAFVDAARLCDAAEPRQVLCTDLVSRASRAYTADDFGPLTTMTLKGLGAVEVREFLRRASNDAPPGLAISVLGPLRVERGHREVEIEGRKERRSLALLAAAAGDLVGVDELIEALWPDRPPRTAERSVHAFIARVRKALEPSRAHGAPSRVLVTEGRGYRLVLGHDALDSARFERAANAAHDDLAAGHALRARRALDDALSLWRGTPFDEHVDAERCSREARRLEDLRQLALEDLTTARLELGEAAVLAPELESLVRQHPWRERLWANLMLALYRTGRQAEALRTFQRARRALVDELGVEPGPELRHLEAAILEHDPALLTSQPGVTAPTHRLPPALDPGGSVLVGRATESALLQATWERASGGAGEFVAVVGPEGVGKTRLVAELAVDAFSRGAVVLHARCDAADRGPEALLDRALRGAGARLSDMEGDTEAFSGETLVRFLTRWSAGRPVLLVLDDLHLGDTSTVEALADFAEWSASAPLLVVATFRSDEDDGVESGPGRIALRSLSRDAVCAIAKMYRADWTDVEVDELAAVSQGLPLAAHTVASEWAQEATRREVHAATERATEARVRLVATRGDLTGGVEGLQRLVEQRRVQLAPLAIDATGAPRVPYRGLETFDREDADLFFGRDQILAELVARVASAPLVVVVGASGSGKSSLVRAGLLPTLATGVVWDPGTWSSTIVTPGRDPLAALATIPASVPEHHLVVVDPLEEVWTACEDARVRQEFCDALVAMSDDERFAVVVCVRADFVDRVAEHPRLAALVSANTFLVPPMSSDELRRVVQGPARRTGLTVEPQLVEAVVADVEGRPGALPLLSTALLATWERREARTLTLKGYRDGGGVHSAIASMADSCYGALPPASQRAARRILLQLSGEDNGVDVRRRVPLGAIGADDDPDARTALDALVARRLVIIDQEVAEVAHEALLRDWPRLVSWLDEDRTGRRLHHHLAASAAGWDAAGRDPAELYRGARLVTALEWSGTNPGEASPLERDFLQAASTEHDAELRTARRSARRLRGLVAAIALLLVVAIAAGSLSLVQRGEARDRARAAELTRLATQAATLDGDRLSLGLLLGIEARRLDPSTTGSALGAALDNVPSGLERVIRVPGGVGYGNFSPNRRRFVTAGSDGKARIVAVPSGRIVGTIDLGRDPDVAVASLSPDGHLVAVSDVFDKTGGIRVFDADSSRPAGPKLRAGRGLVLGNFLPNDSTGLVTASSRELIRWDLSDPSRPRAIGAPIRLPEIPDTQGSLTIVAISPDGRTAATSAAGILDTGPDGETYVWDLDSGAQRLGPLTGRVGGFTPDGTQLMLRGPDRIAFVDTVTGADQSSLPLGFGPGTNLLMSDDGRSLAVSDDATGGVRVFDVATGQPIGQLTSFAASSYPMAFLPRNRLLVGSPDQAAVWRYLDDAPVLATLLPGHPGGVANAQFTPDGSEIVTIGEVDNQVLHFRVSDGKPLGPVLDPGAATNSSLAISPDGSTVAIPGADGTVNIWDLRTGTALSVLPTGQTGPISVEWSPAGPVLATVSSADRAVVLWDVSDPRRPTEQHRLDNGDAAALPIRSVRFSPDGRVVAVSDYPATGWLTLVDVARGRKFREVDKGGQVGAPVVYSPDGKTIATVLYTKGSVVLLDAANGRTRVRRDVADRPGGWGFVHGGRHIAVLSGPGSHNSLGPTVLELWDAKTLEPTGTRMTIARSRGWLTGANPDGTKLVVKTPDGPVLFDLDPEHWEKLACRIAGRNLTRAEWNQYIPGRDYHRTCPT